MKHNVGTEIIYSLAIAEPFIAARVQALDDGLNVMNAAVGTLVRRQILKVVWLDGGEGLLALVLAIY